MLDNFEMNEKEFGGNRKDTENSIDRVISLKVNSCNSKICLQNQDEAGGITLTHNEKDEAAKLNFHGKY